MADDTPAGRPTVWIVIAAVCGLAAIGLGIWAISTKSDLDDANKKLDQQEQQAATTEAAQAAIDRRELARYRAVRRRLISARVEERTLNRRIGVEAGQLREARAAEAAAATEAERRAAALRVAQEQRDLAVACAQGSVAAINDFFDASSATAGAHAAIKKLESVQPQCDDVLR